MSLCWRTFLKFEADEYGPEGVRSFYRFVIDDELEEMFLIGEYIAYGAFEDEELLGVIGLRNGNFLSILFVDENHHHQGVATALVRTLADYVETVNRKNTLRVLSSPYAVGFYHALGFVDLEPEKTEHGMRITPMELTLK